MKTKFVKQFSVNPFAVSCFPDFSDPSLNLPYHTHIHKKYIIYVTRGACLGSMNSYKHRTTNNET